MNIYCDRFSVCNSMIMDRGSSTESIARAKGWHMWHGYTLDGRYQEVTLCAGCVEAHRRTIAPKHQELPGQYPIPDLKIVKPGEEH
jgi:hypothetical protein